MPQAMPIYWMNLYLILTLIFIMIVIKIYFNNLKMPLNKKILNKGTLIWKW